MAQGNAGGSSRRQMLYIDGLLVELTRKRVKNINLRIRRDGTIAVSAAPRVPITSIEEFVRSRHDWIEEARGRVIRACETVDGSCIDGGSWWLWGERLTIDLQVMAASGRRAGCSFERGEGLLHVCADERIADDGEASRTARDRALESWGRSLLHRRVEETLPHCEDVVGASCSAWRLRSMRSRWGSCNVQTKVITLSTQLVHHDPRCLEYVIIHELCHLYEPSHNQRFHALMDRFCPDWRERRRLLNGR